MGLILLLLLLAIALSIPAVQTRLGSYVTERINRDFGTDITVGKVALTPYGGVRFREVMIRDHHQDTLIFAKRIHTNILSFKRLYGGDLLFGDIRANNIYMKVKIYKGESDSNLDRFVALFDSGKPSTKPFLLEASTVEVQGGRFAMYDLNLSEPKTFEVYGLNADLEKMRLYGPDITMGIRKMSFMHHRGLEVHNLRAGFTYTKKNILLRDLDLTTRHSKLQGDVALLYQREDFQDFNNKVRFDIRVDHGFINTDDIRYFYGELGRDRTFELKSHLKGTLNDFTATALDLSMDHSQIRGDVRFVNLLAKEDQSFKIAGDFKNLSSDYQSLVGLLPNILGKRLPTSMKKLGKFNLRGKAEVTAKALAADFYMSTALGNVQSDLKISNINNIDRASYTGYVIMEQFDLGRFMGRADLGKVSLNVDIDGEGFDERYLNTTLTGDVYRIWYNGYGFTNIQIDGKFRKPIFEGSLIVNDPNLFMDFDGSVNLAKKDMQLDFHTQIDYADLVKLKLVSTDTISIFKGDISMQVTGNTIDDMRGNIYVRETSYQNNRDTYFFDDFAVSSEFDNQGVRTISINSPDIIRGSVVGKFEFRNVRKMIENSLGSLYANYSPNKIPGGQFMRFNFAVYNKILEIFMPGISLGQNTTVSGNINSDADEFRLNFSSPEIQAYSNRFHRVNLRLDNKNPLYNAFVEMDSIRTPYYKIADFNLINVTANDTLFVRTEFKGGEQAQDYYNLNLYHTIDPQRHSVVGVSKSELHFKDYLWYLNEQDDASNKVVFDKALKDFRIEDIVLSHEDQSIRLNGTLSGLQEKDLQLTFTNIDLSKVTPTLSNFALEGDLNGSVELRQQKNVFKPTASLVVNNLTANNIPLGMLDIDITGDDSFRRFFVTSSLNHKDIESFTASGTLSVEDEFTDADIDLRFNRFNLSSLSALGGEIITDIHGFASGTARIEGNINDPEINGRLFLDDSGLTIPYLNVEYELGAKSIVDVTESSFLIRNSVLIDPKYQTTGVLSGKVIHEKFSDWVLDLDISSDRILVLDTQDSEDAAYYGTAFIDGSARITGPATGLMIQVDAESEPGTNIKIPINDSETAGTGSYIHFLTAREKYNLGIAETTRDYNGLELRFEFDIDEDAEIEVILDRNTGHGMRGRGRGGLSFQINTLGKFNMWGDFQVYEGIYNFKYGGLIDKKFQVKKFSSIVWEGDPMRAVLNLEAIYKATANPAVLLENPSFNRKVPVEVAIGIRGNLANPEPDFNIDFPTVSSVLKSEIQYRLDDRDTRQTQALYLLSSGGFLSPEGVSQSDLAGNFFERASGLFNDIFSDEDGKLTVGIDYVSPDRRPGLETDGRVGFTLSTKVSERITINGKVGVPVGGINESAIVGDVELQYRVNEDGTLNLRVFNRENDINYIGQGVGYTQGLGLSYEVDFDTFREFANRLFKNLKIDKLQKSNADDLVPDSDVVPDYIDIKGPQEVPVRPNMNKEAIPTED